MIFGFAAFMLMFLGDINDMRWSRKWLRLCFPAGIFLLTASTAAEIRKNWPPVHSFLMVPALVFLFFLVYSLAFALPAKEAYVTQDRGRQVCSRGIYKISRHPGLLFFIGLYSCLAGMGLLSVGCALLYELMNFLLVVFEDRVVFPATISGYREYSCQVAFLIPDMTKKFRE